VAGRSPAHGFCDDEQTRRLLRSRPPRQALAWAGACLGGPVTSARALRGGMSSAVHLVTARRPDGRRAQAVLAATCGPIRTNPTPPPARHGHSGWPGRPPCPLRRCWPSTRTGRLVALGPGPLAGTAGRAAAAYPRHGAAVGRDAPPIRPLPAGELPAARLGAVPAGLGAGRRDQPGPRPGPAPRAAAPRLPPRQRAVALRQSVRGGGLARRLFRARAGRRGALPDRPADDGDRGRAALHGSLGTGGRHDVPPVGRRRHRRWLPRRPAVYDISGGRATY
jgi:hypothetical protein